MTDGVEKTAEAIGAAATGADAPDNVMVKRPSAKAEWTLFAALGALCFFSMFLICILAFHKAWPASSAEQRIHFLGWLGFLSTGGILLIIVAIASPWVGHVEASAGTASLKIDGTGGA